MSVLRVGRERGGGAERGGAGGRGGEGGNPSSWFSFNNLETVKALSLAFCNIQKNFIRSFPSEFGIPNSAQSPDIWQNFRRGISNFRISGLSLIKENCHNSRTSDVIDLKVGPVTKLDKRNKNLLSKELDNDVMSENCDVIFIFPMYGQFGAI